MSVQTPISKKEPKHLSARYKEKRRGHRMNSRVPVRLEWDSQKGKRVKVEAHTRVSNPYGCMVVLEHDLHLDHRVALTNLATNSSNAAPASGSPAETRALISICFSQSRARCS